MSIEEQATQVPEVMEEQEEQDKLITGLENAIETLLSRLVPIVSMDDSPEVNAKPVPTRPRTTEVSKKLSVSNERIESMTSRIRSCVRRLQI